MRTLTLAALIAINGCGQDKLNLDLEIKTGCSESHTQQPTVDAGSGECTSAPEFFDGYYQSIAPCCEWQVGQQACVLNSGQNYLCTATVYPGVFFWVTNGGCQ